EGPCGPTVEFYVDGLEVWNLVFNEYFCSKDGGLKPLENKGVDTGMGLERLAKVMQGVETIFETDLFLPIIKKIEELSGKSYKDNIKNFRIIADHIRGSVFLIADGVLPSNIEKGYILRRLLRRSIRYAKLLGLSENWHVEIVKTIIENYKEYYPELGQKEKEIIKAIKEENEKFGKTLERGLKELEKLDVIDAQKAFNIFQTYGFPLEMIQEELSKKNLLIDETDFQKEFKNHQEKSRAGLEKKFGGHGLIMDTGELKAGSEEEIKMAIKFHTATHLMHQALRIVLGEKVGQMGSDINAERLRFDFSYDRKITSEEIKKVEDLVNEKIMENLEVKIEEMPYKKAMESGALAFFKVKYPEIVKVYSVGNPSTGSGQVFSKEICGGPHVSHTGELGKFKIKKEESSSAGVRRIRAILE
ncbi:MAG: alanine--tRNA ligase-related protein, partial [Patescibacteria group bacterium]